MKQLLSFFSFLIIMSSSQVFAHGYTLDPPARQFLCADAGGNWWPEDGSGIPNEACRAAYQTSKTPLLYTQVHEYALNIPNYRDETALQLGVSNGLLCSAGQERYRGMSITHPEWQKTAVPLQGGQYTLKFNASVHHAPSFFEVYLSKSGFNSATEQLTWSDLELLDSFENVPLTRTNGIPIYEMPINLPSNRQEAESAILFVRWQRIDQAGEGFYNCSDVVFSSNAASPLPTPEAPTPTPEAPTPLPPTPPTQPPETPQPPEPETPTPPPSTNQLNVAFDTQQAWDIGFNGLIRITNNGNAIETWQLTFKLAGTADLSNTVWGAAGSLSRNADGTITLSPNTWGGASIASGETKFIYYGGLGVHKGAEYCLINEVNCE